MSTYVKSLYAKDTDAFGWVLGFQHIASESPYQYLEMTLADLSWREKTLTYRALFELTMVETLRHFGAMNFDGELRLGRVNKESFESIDSYCAFAIEKVSLKLTSDGAYVPLNEFLEKQNKGDGFIDKFKGILTQNKEKHKASLPTPGSSPDRSGRSPPSSHLPPFY